MWVGFSFYFLNLEPELKASSSCESFLVGFISSFLLRQSGVDFTGNWPKDFSI